MKKSRGNEESKVRSAFSVKDKPYTRWQQSDTPGPPSTFLDRTPGKEMFSIFQLNKYKIFVKKCKILHI